MKIKSFPLALLATVSFAGLFFSQSSAVGADDYSLCTLVHGARIRSSDGADIGTVNDLIIDRRSGRVVNVVVATGEDRLVALPYTVVNVAGIAEKNVIVVNVDRTRIMSAPTFSRTELRSFNRTTIDRSVNYFGEAVGERSATKTTTTTGTAATTGTAGGTPPEASPAVSPATGAATPARDRRALKPGETPVVTSPSPSPAGTPAMSPTASPTGTPAATPTRGHTKKASPTPGTSPAARGMATPSGVQQPGTSDARPTPAGEVNERPNGAAAAPETTPLQPKQNATQEQKTRKQPKTTRESGPASSPQ